MIVVRQNKGLHADKKKYPKTRKPGKMALVKDPEPVAPEKFFVDF